MKESRKEHLQITEWERHFYYWNLIYDIIVSFLLFQSCYIGMKNNVGSCGQLHSTAKTVRIQTNKQHCLQANT